MKYIANWLIQTFLVNTGSFWILALRIFCLNKIEKKKRTIITNLHALLMDTLSSAYGSFSWFIKFQEMVFNCDQQN